jgi:hypothetical protein
MPDRYKVIKAIEGCINDDSFCNKCDYDGCVFQNGSCEKDLLADALTLLKEQEAVEPCKDIARNRRCPNCYSILKGKFCHECGQAVKWD